MEEKRINDQVRQIIQDDGEEILEIISDYYENEEITDYDDEKIWIRVDDARHGCVDSANEQIENNDYPDFESESFQEEIEGEVAEHPNENYLIAYYRKK